MSQKPAIFIARKVFPEVVTTSSDHAMTSAASTKPCVMPWIKNSALVR